MLVVIVCLASDIPAYKHTLVVLRRRLSDVNARIFRRHASRNGEDCQKMADNLLVFFLVVLKLWW